MIDTLEPPTTEELNKTVSFRDARTVNTNPSAEHDFSGMIHGLEKNGTWISSFIDLFHNHFAVDPENPNELSPLGVGNLLKIQWDFTKLKNGKYRFDSYEVGGTGYGFVPTTKTLTKLMGNSSVTEGNYTFSQHGLGATATFCFLTHGTSKWFIIVKTKNCDNWYVYEKDFYNDKDTYAGYHTTQEIKQSFPHVNIEALQESGLYQSYEILDPTQLNHINDNSFKAAGSDWFEVLEAEIGTRFRRLIRNNKLEVRFTMTDETGNTVHNDLVPAFVDDIKDTPTTIKYMPGGFKKIDLIYNFRNPSGSDKHKTLKSDNKNKVVGYGTATRDLKYDDHTILEIVDDHTGATLSWVEIPNRFLRQGNFSVVLRLPRGMWKSTTDKAHIELIHPTDKGKNLTTKKLVESVMNKLKKLFKDESIIRCEDDLRDQLIDVASGLYFPSQWGMRAITEFRTFFDLLGVPNFNGKGSTPKQVYTEEFNWCKKHLKGRDAGVKLGDSILDIYVDETNACIELIDGDLDKGHYHKNDTYLLASEESKKGRFSKITTLFVNNKQDYLQSAEDGANSQWGPKYKKRRNNVERGIGNLSYFGLDVLLVDNLRTNIVK